jgi:hypothetical protein
MNRAKNRTLLAVVTVMGLSAGLLAACDSDDNPQVRIVTPQAGSTVSLGSDMKVKVAITANDFVLKAMGECKGDDRCGAAYLQIDGDSCNQPGKPYNNVLGDGDLGQDFLMEALFEHCPANARAGAHLLTVSLHDDAGRIVFGEGAVPARATVSIVTTP